MSPLNIREAILFDGLTGVNKMDVRESLTLNNQEDFRRWLQKNHQTKIEIWLIFYKKSSGKQTLTIAQAVEEALCFGWIQRRLKLLDPQSFAVRFSPRHKDSIWSPANLKRVRRLIVEGKMTEYGLAVLPPNFR
jgi:uncharacterized protein YdeI (YjbR/CyaY-like superfamily)